MIWPIELCLVLILILSCMKHRVLIGQLILSCMKHRVLVGQESSSDADTMDGKRAMFGEVVLLKTLT